MSKSSENIASLLEIQEHLHELMEREAAANPRQYMIPVVVEWRLFSCMVDAAHWLSWHRPQLWQNSVAAQNKDAYHVMNNLIKRVSRYCNNYCFGTHLIRCRVDGIDLEGWFLAEDGDPNTWTNGKPSDEDWLEFEDLRRK